MKKESDSNKEQDQITKVQADLQRKDTKERGQLVSDERAKADKLNKERLQKESERRRKEQRERAEALKQAQALQTIERQRKAEDMEVGGGNINKMVDHLARGRQIDIQANKQGKGAKQEQPYKEESKGISKLREFEAKVHDKVQSKVNEVKEHLQDRTH